jgi:hypothetical protein
MPANAITYIVNQHHPAADDGNPGTPEQPLQTISAAVARVQPGDTVLVKAGVYREQVTLSTSGTAKAPITLQAAPGETVVVNGADLLSGWERVPAPEQRPIWRKTPWAGWADYGTAMRGRGQGPQLILDHHLLTQTASLDDLFPGSYYFDPADGGALYLWIFPPLGARQTAAGAQWWDNPVNLASDDPNDHQVEASVRPMNIACYARQYLTIRGFIARYTTAYAQQAGIEIGCYYTDNGDVHDVQADITQLSRFITIEDCVVEYGHVRGLTMNGEHIVARRCYLRFNGAMGASGHMSHSLMEECVLEGNSTMGHSHGWEAGGVKFLKTVFSTVRRCQFIHNDGPGLWFDWGNSDNLIEQNFCSFNSGCGIMMEVSPHFASTDVGAHPIMNMLPATWLGLGRHYPAGPNIIRNNICAGNRWNGVTGSGIMLQMSSENIVVHNTLVDNAQFGIFVRYHPYDTAGHRCVQNVLLNNLCANNGGSQIYFTPDPADKPGYVAENTSDYNLFFSEASWLNRNESTQRLEWGGNRDVFAHWGKTQANGTYSVEEWQKIWGFDPHSIQGDPRLIAAQSLDYRLHADSPAIAAGTPTTDVTDDFLGNPRPQDQPPTIGAIEYVPERPKLPKMPMR